MKSIALSASLVGIALLAACGPPTRGNDDDGTGSGSDMTDAAPGVKQQCNKMDIVFIVDDSPSMQEEQTNLATNFPMFASVLQNFVNGDGDHIDFRVAVTTTGRDQDYVLNAPPLPPMNTHEDGDNGAFRNNCGSTRRYIDSTDANMSQLLACRADVGQSGPSYEMPLLMSKWALAERVADNTNAGFLRDDALLAIVYLTDEDDISTTTNNWTFSITSPGPTPNWNPADQVQFLDTLKGNRSRWASGVIAGDGNCTSDFGDAVDAARLKDFVNMANSNGTHALFSSICSGDLAPALQNMLQLFQNACGEILL